MDNQKKQELNEEMSLDDLHETVGGTKGHCGFTNETGHCGFTCEDDGSYQICGIGWKIHCPQCWSTEVVSGFQVIRHYDYDETVVWPGATATATCKNCNYQWTTEAH